MIRLGLIAVALGYCTGAVNAEPSAMTVPQLVDICASAKVADATLKGDGFGWAHMSEADLSSWRRSVEANQGGPVEVVGWKQGPTDDDDSLSFWVVPDGSHMRVCAYTTTHFSGLVDALSQPFGAPQTHDKSAVADTAFWTRGSVEVTYSQIGESALVYIVHR